MTLFFFFYIFRFDDLLQIDAALTHSHSKPGQGGREQEACLNGTYEYLLTQVIPLLSISHAELANKKRGRCNNKRNP